MRPCLDKGFVEFLSASPDRKTMELIVDSMKRGRVPTGLAHMTSICMKVRAPLFVMLAMGRFSLIQDDSYSPETYASTLDDVRASDIETSAQICESINMTIEAGHVNREAYKADGCNGFTATFTSTISTYWQGVALGDLQTWVDFANEKHAPHHIAVYQKAVQEILAVEFPRLDDFLRRSR